MMKKIYLVFIAILLFFSSTNAQIKIGLLGGINFSDSKQNEFLYTESKSKTNFGLGGVVDFQFTNNFSVRFEPLYIEKGSYGEIENLEGMYARATFNISYFELPVLFKYSVGNAVQPYMFAGPTIGFKLDSDIMLKAGALEVGVGTNNIMKNIEYSFNLGAGINYKIDELATIFFEAKYVFGLTDIVKKGDFNLKIGDELEHVRIDNDTKYDNRGVQLMVGFMFPLNIN